MSLIAKEQLHALIDNYVKKGRSTDECIGFIDGIEAVMGLIDRLEIQKA